MFSRLASSTGSAAGELKVICPGSGEASCCFSRLPVTGDETAVPETPVDIFMKRKMTNKNKMETYLLRS